MKVKVLKSFCDKDNFAKVYKAGSEVEFTDERAEYLKRLGLVESIPPTPSEGWAIDLTQSWQKIVSDVKACANLEELERALIGETNAKKRKAVVEALQARCAELANPVE